MTNTGDIFSRSLYLVIDIEKNIMKKLQNRINRHKNLEITSRFFTTTQF